MSDNPAKLDPAEPPPLPPKKDPGSVIAGIVIYIVSLVLMAAMAQIRYFNLVLPVLFLALVIYDISSGGWNRTHTGILIGLLLTGGALLLLLSICSGFSV